MYNIENIASGVPLQTALHLYYKPTHVYTHALMTTFIFYFQGRQRKNVPVLLDITYERIVNEK